MPHNANVPDHAVELAVRDAMENYGEHFDVALQFAERLADAPAPEIDYAVVKEVVENEVPKARYDRAIKIRDNIMMRWRKTINGGETPALGNLGALFGGANNADPSAMFNNPQIRELLGGQGVEDFSTQGLADAARKGKFDRKNTGAGKDNQQGEFLANMIENLGTKVEDETRLNASALVIAVGPKYVTEELWSEVTNYINADQ